MKQTDAAYIAGFVDADGSISILSSPRSNPNKKKAQYSFTPRISITNKSNHVMEWIAEIANYDNKIIKFNLPTGRQRNSYYKMFFTGSNMKRLLSDIYPHLKLKQKQAAFAKQMFGLFDEVKSTGGNFRLRSEVHHNNLDQYINLWYQVCVLNNGPIYAIEALNRKFRKQPEELLGTPNRSS